MEFLFTKIIDKMVERGTGSLVELLIILIVIGLLIYNKWKFHKVRTGETGDQSSQLLVIAEEVTTALKVFSSLGDKISNLQIAQNSTAEGHHRIAECIQEYNRSLDQLRVLTDNVNKMVEKIDYKSDLNYENIKQGLYDIKVVLERLKDKIGG